MHVVMRCFTMLVCEVIFNCTYLMWIPWCAISFYFSPNMPTREMPIGIQSVVEKFWESQAPRRVLNSIQGKIQRYACVTYQLLMTSIRYVNM